MRYLPHTPQDVSTMLDVIGARSIDDLFSSIPRSIRFDGRLDMEPALDEAALVDHLSGLAGKNRALSCSVSFLGAGAYAHVVPTAVDSVISRGEFFTAYTPYQPEVSQGTLQTLFEFQTMVAELMGLDVANASLYDGASACAEAVLMAQRIVARQKQRRKVVVSTGLHPEYLETIRTYLSGMDDLDLVEVGLGPDGTTDLCSVDGALGPEAVCLFVQSPNFFGVVEPLAELGRRAKDVGAVSCCAVSELTSLGLLEPPGRLGFEIVVGDGLGMAGPVSLGGPGVGLIATTERNKRVLPGRLVGRTLDGENRVGYVLTLAAREQHIRREKATSNICSNQSLMAVSLAVHLSLLGRQGFKHLARLNYSKAKYLREKLAERGLLAHPQALIYNEFAVKVPAGDAALVARRIFEEYGVLAGVPLGRFSQEWKDLLLVNVTERHRRRQLDALVEAFDRFPQTSAQ
ncbi:MAG: aminomethyl-transferring glycine dehydrogenase subunit GcvPA [Deltaproteobacteria bacterium]|nr:aminomethyl-transferring glycine dehydrogenase subunit GcvPA [Deltaproteobacteria bacterium]